MPGGAGFVTFFDAGIPRSNRGLSRLGHWGTQILIAAIIATIALVLRPLPADSASGVAVPVALFLFVIASWLLMRRHDRRLCEDCMSAMPLNASEVATRYHRRFAVTHLGSNMRLVVAYLVVLIGSNFVLLDGHLLPTTLGRYVWAAIQATMIYLVLSYSTHRRLQPWCGICNGGGGGDTEDVEAPDPVPSGSAIS